MYGWNFTDTHNFKLQHRRESFVLCIIALLCSTYQPRLCALEHLPKEFTGGGGGSLTIRTTSTHSLWFCNPSFKKKMTNMEKKLFLYCTIVFI